VTVPAFMHSTDSNKQLVQSGIQDENVKPVTN